MSVPSRKEMLDRLTGIESSEVEEWSALSDEDFINAILETIQREGTIADPSYQNTTSTKRSEVWNEIAIRLVLTGRSDDALRIWESMVKLGSDHPATLSNYGRVLMERDPMRGSQITAQAYDRDCTRPRREEALLLPAFRNLSLALLYQAQIFHKAGDRFVSLILGWQSIEYTLRAVWMQRLNARNISRTILKDLLRWDISKIIWTLNFMGIRDDPIRLSINNARKKRNRVLHARRKIPTLNEIDTEIIQVAKNLQSLMVRHLGPRGLWRIS